MRKSSTATSTRFMPMPSIRRLPAYLRLLLRYRDEGGEWISCTRIAGELALDATQVRKDLAITGISGKPRLGYPIGELIKTITVFLGWDRRQQALIVGVGNLGRALLGYAPFNASGLEIVLAFDNDPARIGQTVFGRTVLGMERLAEMVAEHRIRVALLTVPAQAAGEVARELAAAGVTGLWNFTPAWLSVPEGVLVEHVDLLSSWAGLSARMTAR